MVLSLADDEVFEAGKALPVAELVEVSLLLKHMLYRLCWQDRENLEVPLSRRSANVLQLLTTGMELFNQVRLPTASPPCTRALCSP